MFGIAGQIVTSLVTCVLGFSDRRWDDRGDRGRWRNVRHGPAAGRDVLEPRATRRSHGSQRGARRRGRPRDRRLDPGNRSRSLGARVDRGLPPRRRPGAAPGRRRDRPGREHRARVRHPPGRATRDAEADRLHRGRPRAGVATASRCFDRPLRRSRQGSALPRLHHRDDPGIVGDTPAWSGKPPEVLERIVSRTPTGRLVAMDDVVHAVLFLLENPSANGVNLAVDGGWLLQ